MSTIFQSLNSISNYPVPASVIDDAADSFGLNPSDELTKETRNGKSFQLTKAMLYDFLSEAPSVSQGGVTFSFSEYEKKCFKAKADKIRKGLGYEDAVSKGSNYGYQGEDF